MLLSRMCNGRCVYYSGDRSAMAGDLLSLFRRTGLSSKDIPKHETQKAVREANRWTGMKTTRCFFLTVVQLYWCA